MALSLTVLASVQAGEGSMELVADDVVVVDVELSEDGLVEKAPLFVVTPPVELLRAREQGKAKFNQPSILGQAVIRGCQTLGEATPLVFDTSQLRLDFGLRDCSAGCEIHQVLLLGVEVA